MVVVEVRAGVDDIGRGCSRLTGPQSRAPLLMRYTNDSNTAAAKIRMANRPNGPERPVHDRPREEEDDLDVEDDEDHRHQEELHREALRRLAVGHDAALVGRRLGHGGVARARAAATPPG